MTNKNNNISILAYSSHDRIIFNLPRIILGSEEITSITAQEINTNLVLFSFAKNQPLPQFYLYIPPTFFSIKSAKPFAPRLFK